MCIKNLNVNFTFYENVIINEGDNSSTTFFNPFDTIKMRNVDGVNIVKDFYAVVDMNYIHDSSEVDWINDNSILLVLTIENMNEDRNDVHVLSLITVDDEKLRIHKSFNLRKVVKISNKNFVDLKSGEYLIDLLIGCKNAGSGSHGQIVKSEDENDTLELKLQAQMILKIV